MATASNFEGYTTSDTFEANSYSAAEGAPKIVATPIASEAGKGYREISGKPAVHVNPLAVFATGVIGIALGVAAGLGLTTGGFTHTAVRAATVSAANQAHPTHVATAPPQKQPPVAGASLAQNSASTSTIPSPAPATALKPAVSLPAALRAKAPTHPTGAAKPAAFKTATTSAAHVGAKTRPAVFLLAKRHTPRFNPDQMLTVPPAPAASATEAHIPALRPAIMIEGDVTISDFDNASGRIETREGKSFILGHTASAANAFSWDEFHNNLHYRCDLAGNCSLSRYGVIPTNARLDL